jgi:hypothetical protein
MNTYHFAVFINRFLKRWQLVDDLHFLATFSQYKNLKAYLFQHQKI